METTFILLWLEGSLQSWGYDSKFNRRDTLEFPTKSGVLGLLLCAMGASGEQRELLARFANLRQTAISFRKDGAAGAREPRLRDFQMIGSGYDAKDAWETNMIPKTSEGKPAVGGGTKLTHRYYLQDAVFAVLMEVPADIAQDCAERLQSPVYPLYLGRRCCVPADFIFQGAFGTEGEALQAALEKGGAHDGSALVPDFVVVDGEDGRGEVFTLNDVPVQFGTRKQYRDRRVAKIAWEDYGAGAYE